MNLRNICRICLRLPKRSIYLYTGNLIEKIKIISSITIERLNELSDIICDDCLKNVNNFYNFRKVILNSNNDLISRLDTLKQTNTLTKPKIKNNDIIPYWLKEIKIEHDDISRQENESRLNLNINLREKEGQLFFDVNKEEHEDNENISQLPNLNDVTAQENDIDINPVGICSDNDTVTVNLKSKKVYRCAICNEIFKSHNYLQYHKMTIHTPRTSCSICGIDVLARNLKKHVLIHSTDPQCCDECGKIFKHLDALRWHKKVVHYEKKFSCEFCGRSYGLMSRLRTHLKIHKDPDSLKRCCSVCGKTVQRLRSHMRSHSGERPHICTYCKKGFSSANALKIHTRLHTNERPYACEYCNSSFPQGVALKAHLKTRHGIS